MSKNLNIHAHQATEEIFDILGVRPTGTQGD
jgi:ppGpp synthetase/RelA/SpoT-type nucleotidyltranferase